MSYSLNLDVIQSRVIPVLVIEDASWSVNLANALVESNLAIVEVTLRTKASWDALENMRQVAGLTLGVGSVSSSADLIRAKEIGVDFAVSAGIRSDLVEKAFELGIPYVPGVSTPSEILLGVGLGLTTLKWFPAETLGGITSLKALAAPFPQMRFIPTGGINQDNGKHYLAENFVRSIGGSWMFPKSALTDRNLKVISEIAREASLL